MMRHLFLVGILMLFTACGDSQNDSQLQLLNQSPVADASSVPVDATISAAFNQSIDPGSIDMNSFSLSSQGESVSGSLQVNGGTVTFSPNQPLSLLTKYTATVSPDIYTFSKQLLTQSCQWSFTTRDGIWDSLATPPQGSESDTSMAAIDDSGRVLLAWSTVTGTYSSFYVNNAWTTPVLLGQGGYLNKIVSVNNSYAVFWQVRTGSIVQQFCARYTSGAWESTETVAIVDASTVFIIPAMFSDNSLLVVYWFYGGSDGSHIYSRRFINGQGWQPDEAIADQTARWYVAGSHRSGKAVIAWNSQGGPPSTAYVQSYDVNTGWSVPVPVGQYDYLTSHSAAVNSLGQCMVAFSTVDDILVASRDLGAGWTQLASVLQKQAGIFYSPPQIALDNLGNAMLVSALNISSTHGYLAMRYDKKSGWQQPVDISGGRSPFPLLVMSTLEVDASGNYLLVWYGYDSQPGDIMHVYSSRYRNGDGWSLPEKLGRQDADALYATVSMNKRGEAVAVWTNFYPPGFGDYTMSPGVGLFH